MMLTLNDLVAGFLALDVEAGDTLLVHSSYKSFSEVDSGPKTLIAKGDTLNDICARARQIAEDLADWNKNDSKLLKTCKQVKKLR